MQGHSKHVRDMREAQNSQSPPVPENEGVGGTSGKSKSDGGNPPLPSSGDNDDAHVNSDLLNTWMQRLQTLTVVTAFLASIDGQLFSLTALNTQIALPTDAASRELVYSCLAGALIFHICAGILGYVASFALIRYRIVDESGDDEAKRPTRRIILEPVRPLHGLKAFLQHPERFGFLSVFGSSQSSDEPPLSLLTQCYYTTLCLSAVGFCLAVTGILSFIWVGLPVPVRIFSTVCLGIGVSAGLWAVVL